MTEMKDFSEMKKLSKGGGGETYRAKHVKSGKDYVIKRIFSYDEKSLQEIAALAQLKHPNIVSYVDSFEERYQFHIVMEHCAAGDLHEFIKRCGGVLMSEAEIIEKFVQVCLAMKHIHDRKVIHRDLKPKNIFVTRRGILKVGDFGICKVLDHTGQVTKSCIGTPSYMSPEVWSRSEYSHPSDIWALGCVLYEIATLTLAFKGRTENEIKTNILSGSHKPIPSGYSQELKDLVDKLLQKDPSLRPGIHDILHKPVIKQRIKEFLTEIQERDEFSHTKLHGQKLKKELTPADVDKYRAFESRPLDNAGNVETATKGVNAPLPKPSPSRNYAKGCSRPPVYQTDNSPFNGLPTVGKYRHGGIDPKGAEGGVNIRQSQYDPSLPKAKKQIQDEAVANRMQRRNEFLLSNNRQSNGIESQRQRKKPESSGAHILPLQPETTDEGPNTRSYACEPQDLSATRLSLDDSQAEPDLVSFGLESTNDGVQNFDSGYSLEQQLQDEEDFRRMTEIMTQTLEEEDSGEEDEEEDEDEEAEDGVFHTCHEELN